MQPILRFLILLSLICVTAISVCAQAPRQTAIPQSEVTIIIQQQQIRLIAPGGVKELRLEVYDQTGELIYDSGVVSGPELTWPLQNTQGQPVASGLYAYTLKTKETHTDNSHAQRGHLIVDRGQDRDPQTDRFWVTSQGASGVGATITAADLTVATSKDETVAGARVINERSESRAIEKSENAAMGGRRPVLAAAAAPVNGAGTAGRIPKWTASDTIDNSIITETSGGNIGVGTTTPGFKLTVAGAIDTSNNYRIDGARVLATPGTTNLFAGVEAGDANTTGASNSFFGRAAGRDNTTGSSNSFFGRGAGNINTTGDGNTFIGRAAGTSNTTENNNTFIGFQANGAAGITNASAVGANALVTASSSLVLGNSSIRVGIGVTAPTEKLQVAGVIHSTAGGIKYPDGSIQTTANTGSGGGVTGVTASGPLASSGGATPNISLSGVVPIANGGTGSSTQNFVDLTTVQTIGGAKTFSNNLSATDGITVGTNATVGNSSTGGAITLTNTVNRFVEIGSNLPFDSISGTSMGLRLKSTHPLETDSYGIILGSNVFPGTFIIRKDDLSTPSSQRNRFVINSNGDVIISPGSVGIGSAVPSQKLEVSGNVKISGAGNGLIFPDGTTQFTASGGGGVTSVTASGPLASSGGATPNLSLTGVVPIANGGTGNITGNAATVTNGVYTAGDQTIDGNKTFTNAVNTNSQYNINGNRVLGNPGGNNLFAGVGAGAANPTGRNNAFFGTNAGSAITTGTNNSFFGTDSGRSNTSGYENAFFGSGAGFSNTLGVFNTFFGIHAGYSNTTSCCNSFFGTLTGRHNTDGFSNSFFGYYAGNANTTGSFNSFFGNDAGRYSTTGEGNTFVGSSAGTSNTTENNNTFVGYLANGAAGINNAAAIGANASVTASNSLVLGSGSVKVGIGVTAPTEKLQVAGIIHSTTGGIKFPDGSIQTTASTGGGGVTSVTATGPLASSGGTTPNISLTGVIPIVYGGTGSSTQNFVDLTTAQTIAGLKTFSNTIAGNISGNAGTVTGGVYTTGDQAIGGNKTFSNAVNTTAHYNINGSRVLGNLGGNNLFAGVGAGMENTDGFSNSFFGFDAGALNTTGNANSFFGAFAGGYNTTGRENSFFGHSAGYSNLSNANSFFGYFAGMFNTTGGGNAFFGSKAGISNTSGHENSFFGTGAGFLNTTASGNSFFGYSAGYFNTTGSGNIFLGELAGSSNTIENNNTFIGFQANGAAGITNAIAIGANASVTQSNSLALGDNSVRVGIGVTAPAAKLDVRSGDIYLGSAGQGVILKSPDGATCRKLTIDNSGALVLTAIACP